MSANNDDNKIHTHTIIKLFFLFFPANVVPSNKFYCLPVIIIIARQHIYINVAARRGALIQILLNGADTRERARIHTLLFKFKLQLRVYVYSIKVYACIQRMHFATPISFPLSFFMRVSSLFSLRRTLSVVFYDFDSGFSIFCSFALLYFLFACTHFMCIVQTSCTPHLFCSFH